MKVPLKPATHTIFLEEDSKKKEKYNKVFKNLLDQLIKEGARYIQAEKHVRNLLFFDITCRLATIILYELF